MACRVIRRGRDAFTGLASVRVRHVRGDDRIAEGTFEVPSDIDDADSGARFDADRMARPEVRACGVGAHDLLVGKDGALDRGSRGHAARGREGHDLDDPGAFLVEEARMDDVAHPRDAIAASEVVPLPPANAICDRRNRDKCRTILPSTRASDGESITGRSSYASAAIEGPPMRSSTPASRPRSCV